jgi:hypothetical protein
MSSLVAKDLGEVQARTLVANELGGARARTLAAMGLGELDTRAIARRSSSAASHAKAEAVSWRGDSRDKTRVPRHTGSDTRGERSVR